MIRAIAPLILFWVLVTSFFALHVHASTEDSINASAIRDIIEECQVSKSGKLPVIGDVPMIGSMLDGALDSITGGPKKRNKQENQCIDQRLETRRAENEREAERIQDAIRTRCQRPCVPNDDWADYCREPGVPDLPVCPN